MRLQNIRALHLSGRLSPSGLNQKSKSVRMSLVVVRDATIVYPSVLPVTATPIDGGAISMMFGSQLLHADRVPTTVTSRSASSGPSGPASHNLASLDSKDGEEMADSSPLEIHRRSSKKSVPSSSKLPADHNVRKRKEPTRRTVAQSSLPFLEPATQPLSFARPMPPPRVNPKRHKKDGKTRADIIDLSTPPRLTDRKNESSAAAASSAAGAAVKPSTSDPSVEDVLANVVPMKISLSAIMNAISPRRYDFY